MHEMSTTVADLLQQILELSGEDAQVGVRDTRTTTARRALTAAMVTLDAKGLGIRYVKTKSVYIDFLETVGFGKRNVKNTKGAYLDFDYIIDPIKTTKIYSMQHENVLLTESELRGAIYIDDTPMGLALTVDKFSPFLGKPGEYIFEYSRNILGSAGELGYQDMLDTDLLQEQYLATQGAYVYSGYRSGETLSFLHTQAQVYLRLLLAQHHRPTITTRRKL